VTALTPGAPVRRPAVTAVRMLARDLRRLPFNLIVNVVAQSILVPRLLRVVLLRSAGIRIPLVSEVQSRVSIRTRRLEIGPGTTINQQVIIENVEPVTIGLRCGIAIGVKLITTSHDISDPTVRAGAGASAGIVIGDGVLIGSGAIVLAGVTIGDGCVIGAGAVVNRDCDPHGLYGGVPARRIRTLEINQVETDTVEINQVETDTVEINTVTA
jgi:maltose O-acetyltransferase